jgi:hypothetical protein
MPICSKCHQKEATVHFTTVRDGVDEESVHLCRDCASLTGFQGLELKKLEAFSMRGKKCEFCGQDAVSGTIGLSGPSYWCSRCGQEYSQIIGELCASERPDLVQRCKVASSFMAFYSDPELRSWSEAASHKAVEIMRERRQQGDSENGT